MQPVRVLVAPRVSTIAARHPVSRFLTAWRSHRRPAVLAVSRELPVPLPDALVAFGLDTNGTFPIEQVWVQRAPVFLIGEHPPGRAGIFGIAVAAAEEIEHDPLPSSSRWLNQFHPFVSSPSGQPRALRALELAGYSHYLSLGHEPRVHTYGDVPSWLRRLPTRTQFVVHRRAPFGDDFTGIIDADRDPNSRVRRRQRGKQ